MSMCLLCVSAENEHSRREDTLVLGPEGKQDPWKLGSKLCSGAFETSVFLR